MLKLEMFNLKVYCVLHVSVRYIKSQERFGVIFKGIVQFWVAVIMLPNVLWSAYKGQNGTN